MKKDKKSKLNFVKMTITYNYYGVGKDLESAKDFAYQEFLEHTSQRDFIYEGLIDFKAVKKEEVSLDDSIVAMVEEE